MSGMAEFKIGWPVVVSSALGIALGMSPLPFYTIGVFAGPLMAEFGWEISQVMSALAVFTMVAMASSPLVGYLTDRLGVRRVVLTSIVLFSLTFMSFAFNTGSMTLLPVHLGRACRHRRRYIADHFHARGIQLVQRETGTGTGHLPDRYRRGRRAGQDVRRIPDRRGRLAHGLCRSRPVAAADCLSGRLPAVPGRGRPAHGQARSAPEGIARGQRGRRQGLWADSSTGAEADWRFWLLAVVFVPLSFAIGGPIPNLETLLGDRGFSVPDAIFLASLIGYSVLVGRLLGGYLLDHIWAPLLACVMLMLPAASMYLFQLAEPSYGQAVAAVVLLGVAAGIEYDLIAYLVSRYFGIRNYAAIYGILYAFFAMGAGFGPAVYGWFFANKGSYNEVLNISMYAFIFCSLALLFLGRYRDEELKAMNVEAAPHLESPES